MNSSLAIALFACLFAVGIVSAHEPEHHAGNAVAVDIPADAAGAVATVDGFAKALKARDFETIQSSLDPAVIVLEAGGAERSRDEYMGQHAIADALSMSKAEVTLLHRTARSNGDTAWVVSETKTRMNADTQDVVLGTETMILRNTADGWKIVHIHWSSRPER
jgi:ketosteroid isomerase-like protein